jgi:hypothetical protein
MIFLGSKQKHFLYWAGLIISVLFLNVRLLACLRLSFDSIFSGLLALTGFVFTARTFITFKLHEVVYGNPVYRSYVEKLQKDGAYERELYDPLKELDESLGNTTGMCLVALCLFALVAFMPDFKEIVLNKNTKVTTLFDVISSKDNIILAIQHPSCVLPVGVAIITDAALLYFFFVLNQIFKTTMSLNRNIKAIINHWEDDYKNSQPEP